MHPHNATFPSPKLRLGNKPEIPDPPPHVPEKFSKVWASLPGCCRNFYMNPGKGCCAGMAEPNPGMMDSHKANPSKAGCKTGPCSPKPNLGSDQQQPKTETAPNTKGWLWAIQDWFKYLSAGFLKDMKRILTGSKTD